VSRTALGEAYERTRDAWPEALAVRADGTVVLADAVE